MIEIQIEVDGPWIPLLRARSPMDLGIRGAREILTSGPAGIRIRYDPPGEGFTWCARRYGSDKQFAWQSGSMAAPAFASLEDE